MRWKNTAYACQNNAICVRDFGPYGTYGLYGIYGPSGW